MVTALPALLWKAGVACVAVGTCTTHALQIAHTGCHMPPPTYLDWDWDAKTHVPPGDTLEHRSLPVSYVRTSRLD